MYDGLIEVEWYGVLIGLGLVAVAIGLTWFNGFGMERDITVGILRSLLQLTILGYVLVYIFSIRQIWITVLLLAAMALAAAFTARGRIRKPYPGAIPILWLSILAGSFFSLSYVTLIAIGDPVALTPRYLIPLGGMVIGNTLNGMSLAGERLRSELDAHRDRVEVLLALGASSVRAAHDCTSAAFTAGMIPTINALMVIGLIQIPGIMVGLVLSGQDPLVAARYQLVIMFMLVGGKVLALTLGLKMSVRKYFTPEHQLRRELL